MENSSCVHISTESENRIIQSFLFSNGFSWTGDGSISYREIDRMYGNKTILYAEIGKLSYGNIGSAKRRGDNILSASDFISYAQDNLIPRGIL